jgi:DNA-binding FrmR family transcriptional regulator
MSHTIRQKTKLLNRVRRIRGQVDAIERALEAEAGCEQVMHVIAACRGALNGLLGEVVEEHIQSHLVEPLKHKDAEAADAAEQLVDVFRGYFR